MNSKLSILIYHRVLAVPDPLFPDLPDATRFARQMAYLKRFFRVLPLKQAARLLQQGRLPARSACITFDDGYRDNLTVALPVLKYYGLHASFFIASDFLYGGTMWNDALIAVVRQAKGAYIDLRSAGLGDEPIASTAERRRTISKLLAAVKYQPHEHRKTIASALLPLGSADLMLNPSQLRQLQAAGMGIGAHTASHPILAQLPDRLALLELSQSRIQLEKICNQEVSMFAYPNGKPGIDYDARHVRMVHDLGYGIALSTRPACARSGDSLLELPRYTPWQPNIGRFCLELVRSRIF